MKITLSMHLLPNTPNDHHSGKSYLSCIERDCKTWLSETQLTENVIDMKIILSRSRARAKAGSIGTDKSFHGSSTKSMHGWNSCLQDLEIA